MGSIPFVSIRSWVRLGCIGLMGALAWASNSDAQDALRQVQILRPTAIAPLPIRPQEQEPPVPAGSVAVEGRASQAAYWQPLVKQEDPFGEGQMKQISSRIQPGRPLSAFRKPGEADRYQPIPYQPVKSKLIFPQEGQPASSAIPPGADPPISDPALDLQTPQNVTENPALGLGNAASSQSNQQPAANPGLELSPPPASITKPEPVETSPPGLLPEAPLTAPDSSPSKPELKSPSTDPLSLAGQPDEQLPVAGMPSEPPILKQPPPTAILPEASSTQEAKEGALNAPPPSNVGAAAAPNERSMSYDTAPPRMETRAAPPTSPLANTAPPAPQPRSKNPSGATRGPAAVSQPVPFFVPAYQPIPGLPEFEQDGLPPSSVVDPPVPGVPWNDVVRSRRPGRFSSAIDQPPPVCRPDCQGCFDCRGGWLDEHEPSPGDCWDTPVVTRLVDDRQACAPCPEDCDVYYFGFQGAINDLSNMFNDSGDWLEVSHGSAFNFALGKVHGPRLRSELELSIRNNEIAESWVSGRPRGWRGDVGAFSGMANVYYEACNFPIRKVVPYAGVGVGFASLDVSLTDSSGAPVLTNGSGRDSSFAYQWMAGVNLRTSEQFELFAEYRFFEADSYRPDAAASGLVGDFDYQANTVGVGFRWKF